MNDSPDPGTQRLSVGRIALWAVVISGAVAVLSISAPLSAAAFGVPVAIALVLGLAQAAAMVFALTMPLVAATLSVASVLTFALVTPPGGPWPVMVTSIVAHSCVVLLISRSRWLTGLAALVAAGLGTTVIALARQVPAGSVGATTADLVVFVSVAGVAWLIGLLLGKWSTVRRQLAREQAVSAAELARRQAAEERARLARELHDVVAHGMSAIQVQASSARYRIASLPADAAEEFDGIAALARTSMSEMRALLAVLRSDGAEAESVPQPTAADVPQLVESAGRTGSRIQLDAPLLRGSTADLDPVLSLTIYRIVQESLSNVTRHATGADVMITLERLRDTVHVEVRNGAGAEARGSDVVADAGGHGIRGMRERVALHGGTLEAVPTDDGGFVVRAFLSVSRP
ncbi:hypothetical protein GCM10028798_25620 [Humibacter antri]